MPSASAIATTATRTLRSRYASGVGSTLGDALISAPEIGALAFVGGRANGRKAATTLADRFADIGGETEAVALGDSAFGDALRSADLAVNATTVGMVDPGMTIDVSLLPASATVFDLVYVPPETPLLAAARARGLRASNGSEMLIAQAAIAFERWTGVGGMAEVMRTAVAPLLADVTARA